MSFFGKDTTARRIEIDPTTLTCDSAEVRSRLDRIGVNYEKLSEILADLENRIETEDRLKTINETIDDAWLAETSNQKPKRRRRRRSATGPKSAGPNKPR